MGEFRHRRFGAAQGDVRFLDGRGTYTDDKSTGPAAPRLFLRSPHAHAEDPRHRATKARAARVSPRAFFTGADLDVRRPCLAAGLVTSKDGSPMIEPPRPACRQKECAMSAIPSP